MYIYIYVCVCWLSWLHAIWSYHHILHDLAALGFSTFCAGAGAATGGNEPPSDRTSAGAWRLWIPWGSPEFPSQLGYSLHVSFAICLVKFSIPVLFCACDVRNDISPAASFGKPLGLDHEDRPNSTPAGTLRRSLDSAADIADFSAKRQMKNRMETRAGCWLPRNGTRLRTSLEPLNPSRYKLHLQCTCNSRSPKNNKVQVLPLRLPVSKTSFSCSTVAGSISLLSRSPHARIQFLSIEGSDDRTVQTDRPSCLNSWPAM